MHWNALQSIKFRIVLTSGGFLVYLVLLLFRSYQLQIPENNQVDNLAQAQYTAKLPAHLKRGTIYDRKGEVLAIDVQVASIALHPQVFDKSPENLATLAGLLNITQSKIQEKLASSKKFEWIARRISDDQGKKIEQAKLKGVSVIPEYRRYYPNRELAGNVLGAVGYDAKALGGIELALDTYLKTSSQAAVANRDAKGRLFTPFELSEIHHDVYLTLDVNLQYVAERHLWEAAQKYTPKNAFALVVSPKTGDILAMANYPKFNPNRYWEYQPEAWKNHAVIDFYEPGSTFKSMIAAAALDSGKVRPHHEFFCENGSFQIGSRTIHDHDAYGNMTLSDILRVSSNIGVTKVARKIGKDAFYDMLVKLGFGQRVDLEFPGIEKGRLSSVKRWTDIDFSNISFGQGVSVNGIQMAQAYAAFANGGVRMKPLLVKKIVNSKGEVVEKHDPEKIAEVMSSKNAQDMGAMLSTVIHGEGTGRAARMSGYAAAGKTGTAQKVDPQTKRYDSHNYVASFIGYAPLKDPEYVIYVVLDSPKPVHTGGAVAAPVFKAIAQEGLPYAGVIPENPELAKNISQTPGVEAAAD